MKRIVRYCVHTCNCGGHVEYECLECKRVLCNECEQIHLCYRELRFVHKSGGDDEMEKGCR